MVASEDLSVLLASLDGFRLLPDLPSGSEASEVIFDLIIGFFTNVIVAPMVAVLPDWTTPEILTDVATHLDLGHYIWAVDRVVPVVEMFHIITMAILLGIALLPIIFVVWLWGAVRL